ncbi:uncharacterized protein FOMMEDRAFT_163623 [Fomitiporia mediterranea MF3/22]|uniref:Uncharacterized protein n=1 Tax=Fomitiporia mediterranea (strain MF3/22) TaxID=694068 RepID=R7SIG9_FOMME|nr:uncharacterized protein FOMMEDRAFT_163623 [Fomitiporia mediterranea MF3/22]EJC97389.1 hypothetical protein FOMMEDRAFT_163623 [Fomitiporia mediterranea MF3/22]
MLSITFDGSTLRAFTFLSAVHDTISNGSSDPPLLSQPGLSTLSTSPSPFKPERPRDTPLKSSTATAVFTAPPIACRSQNMQCACSDMFSPTAQISSFNAPDFNPGEPLTLAVRCRSASIFSLLLRSLNLHNLLDPNPHAHAIRLTESERRSKRGDEDYVEQPEDAFIIFRHESRSQKNQAEAASGAGVGTVEIIYYLLFLYSVI